jgi:hypothetical protein
LLAAVPPSETNIALALLLQIEKPLTGVTPTNRVCAAVALTIVPSPTTAGAPAATSTGKGAAVLTGVDTGDQARRDMHRHQIAGGVGLRRDRLGRRIGVFDVEGHSSALACCGSGASDALHGQIRPKQLPPPMAVARLLQ